MKRTEWEFGKKHPCFSYGEALRINAISMNIRPMLLFQTIRHLLMST